MRSESKAHLVGQGVRLQRGLSEGLSQEGGGRATQSRLSEATLCDAVSQRTARTPEVAVTLAPAGGRLPHRSFALQGWQRVQRQCLPNSSPRWSETRCRQRYCRG